jgi:hypothetical protein
VETPTKSALGVGTDLVAISVTVDAIGQLATHRIRHILLGSHRQTNP